jgi:hypothetical protein
VGLPLSSLAAANSGPEQSQQLKLVAAIVLGH